MSSRDSLDDLFLDWSEIMGFDKMKPSTVDNFKRDVRDLIAREKYLSHIEEAEIAYHNLPDIDSSEVWLDTRLKLLKAKLKGDIDESR